MKTKSKIYHVSLVALLSLTLSSGCKKYLEIPDPTNSLTVEASFKEKGTIDAMMVGMYGMASNTSGFPLMYIRTSENMSDNYYNPNANYDEMLGLMLPTNNWVAYLWPALYQNIYTANVIIEHLPAVPASVLDASTNKSYMGAALTIRAWSQYYLVCTWGDVPLITSSDVLANNKLARTPAADVYAQVITDLKSAMDNLPSTGSGDARYIDNKYIPEAILAKVYVAMGKWQEAEAAASDVIENGGYTLDVLEHAFFRGSSETIYALGSNAAATDYNVNIATGQDFALPPFDFYANYIPTQVSPSLDAAFEDGDLRKSTWTTVVAGRTFQYKYVYTFIDTPESGREQDFVFMRLGELLLLRAEARAQQGNIAGAAGDLDQVRIRAGLANTTASSKEALLDAILHERQVELFQEGSRWEDLKRFGKADEVLSVIDYKAQNYKPYMKLWPIPKNELIVNPNLVQNDGY
jgi:starch-binding outer membrane protein, SusD/RagB family